MTKKKASRDASLWFPIVGIGASAGGLEAVTRLLTHLPADTGMAFILIQHLDPTRESLLPAILQKATKMPVSQAKERMRIEPDHVYIIPPNVHMCIDGSVLKLGPRPEGAPAQAVNCFLNSLALERGNNAIAVILSGTASDGALGVRAIKAEGGVVFAQDEESAGHSGMPHSAAATGTVDYILPPEQIAAELARLALHPLRDPDNLVHFQDASSLGKIFLLLRRETGVDFGLYKPSTIRRRLMRRMMLKHAERLDQYAAALAKNPEEVRALHDDLLIHVTHFFREPAALAALRAKSFPRLLRGLAPDAPIRVWVAGCSTGEEVYSLAILLLDFLSEKDRMNPVQIFATDVSEAALARARAGAYSNDIAHHVPVKLLRRFFTKTDRGYEIVKRVRDLCVFARHDLTKDPPFANLDIISCCNVLIYFGPEAQRRILPVFHYALRPAGTLMLSNAETVGEFGRLFESADKKGRLYYKNPTESRIHYSPSALLATDPGHLSPAKPKAAEAKAPWPETDVQKTAERLLLARFAPAGLIVGSDLNILHFRGNVSRFLAPASGKASLSLLKMMPVHTGVPLRALIEKAKKADSPTTATGLELGGDGSKSENVTIEVIPFRLPISGDRYFILLFEEELPLTARPKALRAKDAEFAGRRERASVKRLKTEIASTRAYLQSIVEEHEAANEELKSANEELKSANEEIVSSNEELQSTNEELEIAKEELQAANEELSTLNEELQTRNGDLGGLNNDLSNLLSSVNLPIIMVGTDQRIRRFTPMAEKVMNLIAGDVGRSIGDIKPKIPLPNIEEIIHDVIQSASTKELEIRATDGVSYLVRVRPYKTSENKIDGAVLVFMPDDQVNRGTVDASSVSAFEAALDIVHEPLAVLDANMRVKTVSRSMYQAFGLTPSQLGRSLFEIEDGRWNLPKLRKSLERLSTDGAAFSRLTLRVGKKPVTFSARRVERDLGGEAMILLSIDER